MMKTFTTETCANANPPHVKIVHVLSGDAIGLFYISNHDIEEALGFAEIAVEAFNKAGDD